MTDASFLNVKKWTPIAITLFADAKNPLLHITCTLCEQLTGIFHVALAN